MATEKPPSLALWGRLRQLNLFSQECKHLRAGLNLAFNFVSPPTSNWTARAHLQNDARIKPSPMKKRSTFCACRGILEQIGGDSWHFALLKKKTLDRRHLPWITCEISIFFTQILLRLYCYPIRLMLYLSPNVRRLCYGRNACIFAHLT